MNREKAIDILRDVGEYVQKLQLLAETGKAIELRSVFPATQRLIARCKENGISVCVYIKKFYPAQGNQFFSVTEPKLHDWPSEDGPVHAHITCVFRVSHNGHPEINAEGVEVTLLSSPAESEAAERHPEPSAPETAVPSEGRVLSEDETKRFLKSMGLEDLL